MTGKRAIVAEFVREGNRSPELWSMVVIEEGVDRDGREFFYRKQYDIEVSRQYGYLYHQSGGGGSGPVKVNGIYFVSGDVEILEGPCQLVDPKDNPPWRGRKTKFIRKRNRTHRLLHPPKQFDLRENQDLLHWLQENAIEQDAVWCSTCRDHLPEEYLCEHCWWCGKIGWYSTPSERCDCKEECDV